MLYRSCTEVVHRLYRNCPSCILVVFWLYFGCISCICLVTLTTHRNFAPHSRNQNSCLRCNFILQAFLGSRLEASSPRDSPSKLGSPLGSSLLDRLEHNILMFIVLWLVICPLLSCEAMGGVNKNPLTS